jgi:hypothetical protein
MFGRSATEEMTVTVVEPQRSYVTEASGPGVTYVSGFAFAPAPGGGTDVTATFGGRPTTTVGRVLAALTGAVGRRAIARALAQDLEDIATAAERG